MEWLCGTAWDGGDQAALMVVSAIFVLAVPVLVTYLMWVVIGKIRGK